MGVYIDMEMPKEGFVEILVRDDGTVQQAGQSYRIDGTDYYTPYVGEMPVIHKAVPVPTHGRLIDADALIAKLNMMIAMAFGEGNTAFHFAYRSLGKVVENAPTIIEAEEGET